MPKGRPKKFVPTSAFAPIEHKNGKAKAEPVDPLQAILAVLQPLVAQQMAPRQAPEPAPVLRPASQAKSGDWIDTFNASVVNSEWRNPELLMSKIGHLESFRDWAMAEIKHLKQRIGA